MASPSNPRLRYNDIFGTASSNPITLSSGSATTCSWSSAPAFPITIASPNYAVIIAEPDTANEEIMYLTAYTFGATSGTVTRGQEGTSGITHSATAWAHGPTALDFPSVSPLATVIYNPGTATSYSGATSATFAVIDSTNLTISFIVPASGNARVTTEILGITDGSGSAVGQLALFVHGGAVVASTETWVLYNPNSAIGVRLSYVTHLTGLSVGTTVQYDLASATRSGAGTFNVSAGGTGSTLGGPAVMQAFAE